MKENKYDDESFFEKYCAFPRSAEGLSAAGEWETLQRFLPDFTGKRVLDIGCGLGWHCRYAAEQGASYILGTDLSEKMLAMASEKNARKNIEYRRVAMEELELPENSFDIALSSLAFHYTPDFAAICKKVRHCLTPGGKFIFSVEHPIFTAYGPQDWKYDAGNKIDCWPVDGYFFEGRRDAVFLGEKVIKYHRTLTTYLGVLLETGFSINAVVEPQPPQRLLDCVPGMRDELRRPMMLIVSATRI